MGVNYNGLDDIYKKLETIIKDVKSQSTVKKILQEFGVISKSRIRENFNKGVDPYGVTWAPLKAGGRYVKSGKGKGRLDTSANVLLDDGRLVGSVNYKTYHGTNNKNGYSSVIMIYNKDTEGTATADYGVFHQFGIGVTARPFLPSVQRGIPDQWYKDLDKITDKIIKKLADS